MKSTFAKRGGPFILCILMIALGSGCFETLGNGKLDVDALTKLGNIEQQATSLADRVDKGQERAQRACELAQRLRGQADALVGLADDPKANAAQAAIVAVLDRICARVTPVEPAIPAFRRVVKYYVIGPSGNEIQVTKDTPIKKRTVYEPLPVPPLHEEDVNLSQLSVSGAPAVPSPEPDTGETPDTPVPDSGGFDPAFEEAAGGN